MIGRRATLFVLLYLLSACGPRAALTPAFSTPSTLGKTVTYWDMGLSVSYADGWPAPQFTSGQVLIATASAMIDDQKKLAHPFVALKAVDPIKQLRLPADATLTQIATAALQDTVSVSRTGRTGVGGLDAEFVEVDQTQSNVHGLSIAFRLPDGRVGVLLGVSPIDQWAYFAPVLEQVRSSGVLIKTSSYPLPRPGTTVVTFAAGGLALTPPEGWKVDTMSGGSALVMTDPATERFGDQSGFANGAQLALLAHATAADGADITAKFARIVQAAANSPIQKIDIGGRQAAMVVDRDPVTGQNITLIGVIALNQKTITVFRWTTPYSLTEVLRPTIDAIMASVKYRPG